MEINEYHKKRNEEIVKIVEEQQKHPLTIEEVNLIKLSFGKYLNVYCANPNHHTPTKTKPILAPFLPSTIPNHSGFWIIINITTSKMTLPI